MAERRVKDLFAREVDRRIEEVIKVDQTDEHILREEIDEYVATDAIRNHFARIFDAYAETRNKPHEGIGIWISGFFGSGKSSFAKLLGLALENRQVLGEGAAERCGRQIGDRKIQALLAGIRDNIPTDAVIFDVSTERGVRSGSQTLTEITYRLFLQHLGYAPQLDLSELEISLEDEGRLAAFKQTYAEIIHKDWDAEKGKIAFALSEASRVMHALEPATYPQPDSWLEAARGRADVTPGRLAERCQRLMDRRRPQRNLVFVIDEVGQFVARDVQKMLDLQAVVQSLGRVGRGRLWIVVTSQEKLTELVGGIDDRRVELARLMDRFPLQVHLEPSDISEVTSKRVLRKNAAAESVLRTLLDADRNRLIGNTRLSADIRLPEITTASFIDLYPLLPYQVQLIIDVVSGLRTQRGTSRHVGGANRTIIKLAQQLLIHPDVHLGDEPVGVLARIDQIYDLVSSNITSEVRGKIDAIAETVPHPIAQAVAKAVCLLEQVKSIHGTAENVAAALHPSTRADSRLPEVRQALADLLSARMVREGESGYRIPSPVEDDWERQRDQLQPRLGDVHRIHAEIVAELWKPQPSHNFHDTKMFKAGLVLGGRQLGDGDVDVHMTLVDPGEEFDARLEEMRRRSQSERQGLFWVVALDAAIDHATTEVFRSDEILTRRERGAQTPAERTLIGEESRRLRERRSELRRLLQDACLAGTIFFRGNDRSPGDAVTKVDGAAAYALRQALPEVFDRFEEAAARVTKKDLDALMTSESLHGLTELFTDLALVRDQGGKPVFVTDGGPLAELLARIENRTSYGETASGRYLTDEFAKEPFGWSFDMVRLLVVALLRAGAIEATVKGQLIESALSLEARNTLTRNNQFKAAAFRPKERIDFEKLLDAAEHYKTVFGREVAEIEQVAVAHAVRQAASAAEEGVQEMYTLLSQRDLPGAAVLHDALERMREIRKGNEERAILIFNACYRELQEGIRRAAELERMLDEPRLHDLERARLVIVDAWPFLTTEPDLDETYRAHAAQLSDVMERESFYQSLPEIDEHTRELEGEYQRRYEEALAERHAVYRTACEELRSTPGWDQLDPAQQQRVAEPLASRATTEIGAQLRIPELRADVDACPARLSKAIEEMMRMVDGSRVVQVRAARFFAGGIETDEQLRAALDALREECLALIGAGKKVLVQ